MPNADAEKFRAMISGVHLSKVRSDDARVPLIAVDDELLGVFERLANRLAAGPIAVEERLPEIGIEVLAFGVVYEAKEWHVMTYQGREHWLIEGEIFTDLRVTHWQELPPPPLEPHPTDN